MPLFDGDLRIDNDTGTVISSLTTGETISGRPARMIAVIRANTMMIFSFSQTSAITVRHRMMPVAASSAA